MLNPMYSLEKNFITSNAYKCIELNAHSLIIYMMTIRDHPVSDNQDRLFTPWLLGSQSCEKVFRTAHSMTSMFSTILNFGVLGLSKITYLSNQEMFESVKAANKEAKDAIKPLACMFYYKSITNMTINPCQFLYEKYHQ